MRSRAWAWLLALIALVLAVIPLVGMAGFFGTHPMSIEAANVVWIAAIVLTIASFGMSVRQAIRTTRR